MPWQKDSLQREPTENSEYSEYSETLNTLKMRPTDLQSKVIAFLRFPLIVLVLFAHCNYTTTSEEWASLPFASGFIDVFSQRIAPIALPLFFFISGYLFFKTGLFSIDIWLKKLTRRFQSLFMPYVLWNLLYLILVIIIGLFTSEVPILGIPISDMSWSDVFKSFWNIALIENGSTITAPVAIQFWFIRDLMVAMVFAPVIFFAISLFIRISGKRPLVRYLLFLAIIYAFGYWPEIVGFNADCWLFFAYGAYFGIKKKEFIVAMLPYAFPALILLVLLIITEQYLPCEFVYRLENVTGLVFIMSLTTMMVRSGTWYVNMTLANASFFIFSYHYMVLGFIIMLLSSGVIPPFNDYLALFIYLFSVALVVGLGLFLYWLMRTRMPFITYILMGGRR